MSLDTNQLTGFCEENVSCNLVLSEPGRQKETPTAVSKTHFYISTKIRCFKNNTFSALEIRQKSRRQKNVVSTSRLDCKSDRNFLDVFHTK